MMPEGVEYDGQQRDGRDCGPDGPAEPQGLPRLTFDQVASWSSARPASRCPRLPRTAHLRLPSARARPAEIQRPRLNAAALSAVFRPPGAVLARPSIIFDMSASLRRRSCSVARRSTATVCDRRSSAASVRAATSAACSDLEAGASCRRVSWGAPAACLGSQ
jgi:hypothetical protein